MDELIEDCFKNGHTHFLEMSGGNVNPTEMVASLINQKASILEGIHYAQESNQRFHDNASFLTPQGLHAATDRTGTHASDLRGRKEVAPDCVSFESHAYINLGYEDEKNLGPGEVVFVTPGGNRSFSTNPERRCVYVPSAGILWILLLPPMRASNVEEMRYKCGDMLAMRECRTDFS